MRLDRLWCQQDIACLYSICSGGARPSGTIVQNGEDFYVSDRRRRPFGPNPRRVNHMAVAFRDRFERCLDFNPAHNQLDTLLRGKL